MTRDVVGELLAAIEAGRGGDADVFTPDAEWDATVPDWRYQVRGERAVREKFAEWFGAPNDLQRVRRLVAGDGVEVVELDLQTVEDGRPVWAHQLHVFELRDGRIARDVVFCGGSWTAERVAEMTAAQAAADAVAAV